MNTNNIELMKGSVNVTIHKNYLKDDDSTYAKVKRTTAGMNNVIATILKTQPCLTRLLWSPHKCFSRKLFWNFCNRGFP